MLPPASFISKRRKISGVFLLSLLVFGHASSILNFGPPPRSSVRGAVRGVSAIAQRSRQHDSFHPRRSFFLFLKFLCRPIPIDKTPHQASLPTANKFFRNHTQSCMWCSRTPFFYLTIERKKMSNAVNVLNYGDMRHERNWMTRRGSNRMAIYFRQRHLYCDKRDKSAKLHFILRTTRGRPRLFAGRRFGVNEVLGYFSGRQVGPSRLLSKQAYVLFAYESIAGVTRRRIPKHMVLDVDVPMNRLEWIPAMVRAYDGIEATGRAEEIAVDGTTGVTGYVQYVSYGRLEKSNAVFTPQGYLVATRPIKRREPIVVPLSCDRYRARYRANAPTQFKEELHSIPGDTVLAFRFESMSVSRNLQHDLDMMDS